MKKDWKIESEEMSKPKAWGVMGKVPLHIQNYNISERKQGDKSKCESPMALKTHTANRVKKKDKAHSFCSGPNWYLEWESSLRPSFQ